MDFLELLNRQEKAYAKKAAVIFREQEISYALLKERSFGVAAGLSGLGVGKGDKVAIYLPNTPEYVFSLFGIFLLRSVAVPLDFMLTEEEVINFLNHSESKVLIAQEKKTLDLMNVKNRCPSLKEIILLEENDPAIGEEKDFLLWGRLMKNRTGETLPVKVRADEKDHAAIFYTSGSTGHPKGVLLTYAHLNNPPDTFAHFIHPDDSYILVSPGIPFSHLGGLDYLLFILCFGCTLVLQERFHPLEFLRALEKYRATLFCIVPSMYVAVLSLKEFEKFDFSSLKYAVVFGAPSSPELLARFHRACPNAYLLNGWGMTETSAPNIFLPTGTGTREIPGTGHFPPGTEAKAADDDGKDVGLNKEGELWVRGPCVMAGYFKEPELSSLALTKDGWLKTGDMVMRDSLGRFRIVGRKKEMLKVAGEIVFTQEVEEALLRHPKVSEAAVVGMADKMRGEVPRAFVSLKEKESLEKDELRDFLRQHLAHFKIPHHFDFLPALPKNRVGKIDKEKLKSQPLA